MSQARSESEEIRLDVGVEGLNAIEAAVTSEIERHRQRLERYRALRSRHDVKRVKSRAHLLARFLRDVRNPETGPVGPVAVHVPDDPTALREELTRIYVSVAPEERRQASRRAADMPVQELAELLAGWGHRAENKP